MPQTRVALLVRRWYLVLATVVLAIASVGFAFIAVPAQYTATASVLLVPPTTAGSNPYLSLSGLASVGDVLALDMASTEVTKLVNVGEATGTYTVVSDTSSNAPIMVITTEADTKEAALATRASAVSVLPDRLIKIQQHLSVPSTELIATQNINTNTEATAVRKSQQRAIIAAFALSLLVGFVLLAGVENLSKRRKAKRAAASARAESEDHPSPDDAASAGDVSVVGDDLALAENDLALAPTAGEELPVLAGEAVATADPTEQHEPELAVDSASVDAASVNGASVNGASVNGHGTNGHAVNGRASNGRGANGAGLNGAGLNGAAASGASVNGHGTKGHTNGHTNGHAVNGSSVNGHRTNGAAGHGDSVNGTSINGTPVNGIATNGIATNSTATNSTATNSTATNGTATNGTATAGKRRFLFWTRRNANADARSTWAGGYGSGDYAGDPADPGFSATTTYGAVRPNGSDRKDTAAAPRSRRRPGERKPTTITTPEIGYVPVRRRHGSSADGE